MREEIFFENKSYKDIIPIHVGCEDCEKGHSFGPAIRNCYLIHYVIGGKGTFSAAEKEYSVKPGQLFLIKPEEITTYTADSENPWNYIWVGFGGDAAAILQNCENRVISCDAAPFIRLKELIGRRSFKEEIAISCIFLILTAFFDDNDSNDFVSTLKSYIYANYMSEIKIEQLAKSLGYSRQHISRAFKAKTGISPQAFLTETRIKNAKKFLNDGHPVNEVAYLCGYNDVFNFSKIFKSKTGLSPSDWKKHE